MFEKQQTFPIFDLYMTRRAVSCRVIPIQGPLAEVGSKNSFVSFGVFNIEFLEICKFVSSIRIFCMFNFVMAFDSCIQLANRFWNEAADLHHGGSVHDTGISKFQSQKSKFRWSLKYIPEQI